jgi:hypothetical protein
VMRIRVNVRKGKGQDGHDCRADEQNRKTAAGGYGVRLRIGTKESGFGSAGRIMARPHGLRGFFGGREVGRCLFDAKASGSVMRPIEFDSDVSPTLVLRCEERGAATAKWV